jgi:hypothetical protein
MSGFPSFLKNSNGFGGLQLLLVVLGLVVAATAVYVTYAWQRREVDSLNKQVTTLQEQAKKQTSTTEETDTTGAEPTTSFTSQKGVKVKLYTPTQGATVATPLVVMGEVPGNWSFEASFPVKLLDDKGAVIAEEPAELLDDWMTEKMVGFTTKLTYNASAVKSGSTGKLVLEKDNPSGLDENDDSVTIEVRF